MKHKAQRNPWLWVPALYYTEGLPYIIVNVVSVIMYKRLDLSNLEIGLYTSWLYLPWVIKPLWSPMLEVKGSKRNWFLTMQFFCGLFFCLIGLALNLDSYLFLSLFFFWCAAFCSATHDIGADGYYMLALEEKQQSFFIGIRSTFYRLAMISGQGVIVVLAGTWETTLGSNRKAWSLVMITTGVFVILLGLYNLFATPKIEDHSTQFSGLEGIKKVFSSFFKKKKIGIAISFILLYRLGESQLVKMASPFLLDTPEQGGLAISTTQIGTIYGTIGLIFLSLGGILGGFLISRDGLGKWIWPMAIAMNLPNALYIILAIIQPESTFWITSVVILEQFGYGFGFTSFLMFTIYVADGASKTAHYAIATGLMALGMMIPGMISGAVQQYLGYSGFFIWVLLASIPGMFLIRYLHYPHDYGKKISKPEIQ